MTLAQEEGSRAEPAQEQPEPCYLCDGSQKVTLVGGGYEACRRCSEGKVCRRCEEEAIP